MHVGFLPWERKNLPATTSPAADLFRKHALEGDREGLSVTRGQADHQLKCPTLPP